MPLLLLAFNNNSYCQFPTLEKRLVALTLPFDFLKVLSQADLSNRFSAVMAA
jgi:hypothetical protein